MKVEIDLNAILQDEYGSETLQESIKRQVVEQVANETRKEVKGEITKAVQKAVKEEIQTAVADVIVTGLDEKYTVTDTYGVSGGTKTLREIIRETVRTAAVYKNSTYSSDQNQFTRAVNNSIETVVKESMSEIKSTVDLEFRKKLLNDAVAHIKNVIGLK